MGDSEAYVPMVDMVSRRRYRSGILKSNVDNKHNSYVAVAVTPDGVEFVANHNSSSIEVCAAWEDIADIFRKGVK